MTKSCVNRNTKVWYIIFTILSSKKVSSTSLFAMDKHVEHFSNNWNGTFYDT